MTEGTILVVPKAIGNGRVDLELFTSEVCVVVTSWKGKRRGLWSGTPGGWQHTEPNGEHGRTSRCGVRSRGCGSHLLSWMCGTSCGGSLHWAPERLKSQGEIQTETQSCHPIVFKATRAHPERKKQAATCCALQQAGAIKPSKSRSQALSVMISLSAQ